MPVLLGDQVDLQLQALKTFQHRLFPPRLDDLGFGEFLVEDVEIGLNLFQLCVELLIYMFFLHLRNWDARLRAFLFLLCWPLWFVYFNGLFLAWLLLGFSNNVE